MGRRQGKDLEMKLILVMAVTLDGKIGKTTHHFPDWTGKEDKRLFAKISRKAGAVIMGSRTFDTLGKPLPDRKNVIMTRDSSRHSSWENLVYTDKRPRELLQELEKEGFNSAVLAGGSLVNSLFAEEELIDEMVITISPKIFGCGLSLFSEEISLDLDLIDVKRLGDNLVCLRYLVAKGMQEESSVACEYTC